MLGQDFFDFGWTAAYILASGAVSIIFLIFLPASCFPSEVANMRSTLLHRLYSRFRRLHAPDTSLETIGR
jgi:hypothetical protein